MTEHDLAPPARTGPELDGRFADRVLVPGTVAEIREIVAEVRAEGTGLVPWGGGTAIHVGNPVASPFAAIRTSRFTGFLTEYSPADLVVTAGAGMPISELHAFLAGHGQRVPLEAPPDATLGGVVAANVAGKRRLSRGTARDWLVGLQAVAGTGKAIRAGGRVVKNVTGYDFCKLYVGSRGTLGVLTELSFKVEPLPETVISGVVRCRFEDAEAVRRVAVDAHAAWIELRARDGAVEVEFGFEGYPTDVEAQTGRVSAALRRECVEPPHWSTSGMDLVLPDPVSQDPVSPGHIALRVGVLPDRLASLLAAGPPARIQAHLGTGIALVSFGVVEGATDPAIATWRRLAAEAGGWAVMERGPKADGADVFGPTRPEWALGHQIKRALDPDAVWCPGRGPGLV